MNNQQAQAIIRKIKQDYNTIAAEWNTSRGGLPSGVKLAAIKRIPTGARVLDLGCGNAFVMPFVLARKAKYFGIDISSELIKIAKKKFASEIKSGQAELRVGSAIKLPYKNNYFDSAISYAVMHHVPSEKLRLKFLQELYRVLKPGGQAIVINWNVRNEWADKRFKISEQLKNTAPDKDEGDVIVPWKATQGKEISRYIHVFTKKEILDLARLAGFKKASAGFYRRDGHREENGEELVLKLTK